MKRSIMFICVILLVACSFLHAADVTPLYSVDGKVADGARKTATLWSGAPIYARPYEVYYFMDDFFSAGYLANAATIGTNASVIHQGGKYSEIADHAKYLVTVVDGDSDEGESIVAEDNAIGGWNVFTCNNKSNDNINIQMNGESFYPDATHDIWYETKIEIEDVDKDIVYMGLGTTVADWHNADPDDYIAFRMVNSTGIVDGVVSYNGVMRTNAALTTMYDADTGDGHTNAVRLGFFYDASATSVFWYVDGVCVGTNVNDKVPNDEEMTPSKFIETIDTGADALKVDFTVIMAER